MTNEPVQSALLPSIDLPDANWGDRHSVIAARSGISAVEAAKVALGGKPPGWIRALLDARNIIVGWFGLKPAAISADRNRIGAFPIVRETQGKVVLGFDDWHLDFRIVVETAEALTGTNVTVSTLVNRKNWFGRAYIFLITPFHVLIVRRLLANLRTHSI